MVSAVLNKSCFYQTKLRPVDVYAMFFIFFLLNLKLISPARIWHILMDLEVRYKVVFFLDGFSKKRHCHSRFLMMTACHH